MRLLLYHVRVQNATLPKLICMYIKQYILYIFINIFYVPTHPKKKKKDSIEKKEILTVNKQKKKYRYLYKNHNYY